MVFHHPLYSSGERHGSNLRLREVLEPLFLKYNVSVVLNGHDHSTSVSSLRKESSILW